MPAPDGRYTEGDTIFDGFCYRQWQEDLDGWMNEVPSRGEYPVVAMAEGILDLYRDLTAERRENWALKKRVKQLETVVYGHPLEKTA